MVWCVRRIGPNDRVFACGLADPLMCLPAHNPPLLAPRPRKAKPTVCKAPARTIQIAHIPGIVASRLGGDNRSACLFTPILRELWTLGVYVLRPKGIFAAPRCCVYGPKGLTKAFARCLAPMIPLVREKIPAALRFAPFFKGSISNTARTPAPAEAMRVAPNLCGAPHKFALFRRLVPYRDRTYAFG